MLAAFAAAGAQDAAPPADAVPVPEPELLEFLGEFADADGEFADPAEIAGALERAADPDAEPDALPGDDNDAPPDDPPR